MSKGEGPYEGGGKEGDKPHSNSSPIVSGSTPYSPPTSKQKQKPFKPGLVLDEGRQTVKGYSVTEDQLETLSTIGHLATASLAAASGLLGFALNLMVSRDFTPDAPKDILAYWSGVEAVCYGGVILFAALGVFFGIRRWSKISSIKKKTEFKVRSE